MSNNKVDTTIFPKVNFIRDFEDRAVQRDRNGRIYGPYSEDLPEGGVTCFRVSFPHDLAVGTLSVYDLREDCGNPTIIDLNS